MSEEQAPDHSSASAYREAEQDNLQVVLPEPHQLLIDIDDQESMVAFDKNYILVDQLIGIAKWGSTPSRRKKDGRHITVDLQREVTPLERVALQLILGSDRRREFYSFERIENDDPYPTLFLEKR